MYLEGLFIDGFAGGGGASTGIAQAIGRDPDIAVNHSPTAIAIHKANHPDTTHYCQDIKALWPRVATRDRHVAGAWFSPDCKEYSKAKGGPVKDRSIRALCWEVVWWLDETRPEVAYLENVEEFEYAAPLDADGVPIIALKGKDFQKFVGKIRRLGYRVDWKTLRACDYGAPTTRKRLYMVMRLDKKPIVWPKPTHAPANDNRVLRGELQPYRTAAECIDWSIPCPSIFGRAKELAEATKRRIAHGVMRYVVNAARPFIVPVTHQGSVRVHDIDEPARTITGAHRGELAAVDVEIAPHITKFHGGSIGSAMDKEMPTVTSNGDPARPAGAMPLGMVGATLYRARNGEREGQAPRALDPTKPLGTVAAEASGFGLAQTQLAPFVSYGQQGGLNRPADKPLHVVTASQKDTNGLVGATLIGVGGRRGQSPPMPVDGSYPTTTAKGDAAVATAFLSRFYGSDKRGAGGDVEQPAATVRAGGGRGGTHQGLVAAHLEQANTGMVGHTPRKPLSTIVGKGCTQRIVETTMIEEGELPPEMMESAVKVAAFLVKYYGTDGEGETAQVQPVDRPLDAITTKARFAVVTVTIDAVTYVIVDIGLRMLKPRELALAQGFPDDYVLDPIVRKFVRGKWVERRLTIAEQISAIGNSVCPPVARALVAANQPGLTEMRRAA